MVNWTPRDDDINWTRNLINMLNDGGMWIIPVSKSTFKIYKQRKEYELVGDTNHPCNQRVMIVLSRLGYKAVLDSN